MYLIRIARAEAYEAAVGVTEKSALWGAYISRLDNTLRGLLNDLAVTRAKRKQLERRDALMVSIEELLERLAEREAETRRVVRRRAFRLRPKTVYKRILADWRREKIDILKERGDCHGEEDS